MGLFRKKKKEEEKKPQLMYKTLYIISQEVKENGKYFRFSVPKALPDVYKLFDKNLISCVKANPVGTMGFQYEIVLYGTYHNILNFMRDFACHELFCKCFMLSDKKEDNIFYGYD